jgi:hypothetical protein
MSQLQQHVGYLISFGKRCRAIAPLVPSCSSAIPLSLDAVKRTPKPSILPRAQNYPLLPPKYLHTTPFTSNDHYEIPTITIQSYNQWRGGYDRSLRRATPQLQPTRNRRQVSVGCCCQSPPSPNERHDISHHASMQVPALEQGYQLVEDMPPLQLRLLQNKQGCLFSAMRPSSPTCTIDQRLKFPYLALALREHR